jgi:hypothetical protein
MDVALVAEAQRQLGNLRFAYDERKPKLPGYLASGQRDRAYARMLDVFRSEIQDQLLSGQAYFVLDANPELASKAFREASDWLPLFDEIRQAAASQELRLSLNLMLEPIVCLLLANDWDALASIASVDLRNAFLDPQKEPKAARAWAHFMRELMLALRPANAADSRAPELETADTFAGYERLLNAVLASDLPAFNAARAAAEAAYPARKKKRNASLNWFGHGTLGQLTTFDALGTALSALAVHRGLPVAVDSALYPRVFIHGQRG